MSKNLSISYFTDLSDGEGYYYVCPHCGGTGVESGDLCKTCNGHFIGKKLICGDMIQEGWENQRVTK